MQQKAVARSFSGKLSGTHTSNFFFFCVCEILKKLCSKCHFPDLFYHTQTWRFSLFYEGKPPAQLHFGKRHFIKVQVSPEVVLRATNNTWHVSELGKYESGCCLPVELLYPYCLAWKPTGCDTWMQKVSVCVLKGELRIIEQFE